MNHFRKQGLICGLFFFCVHPSYAQKAKAAFPYSRTSLVELIRDTEWVKKGAEEYLQDVNDGILNRFLPYGVAACAMLDRNDEGLKMVSDEMAQEENSVMGYSWQKALYSIWYGYFYHALHPAGNSYYRAVDQAFAKCDPSIDDRKYMYGQQIWPDSSEKAANSYINSSKDIDDSIANRTLTFLPSLHKLDRAEKVLKPKEMEEILAALASRKIALAIRDEQIRFANDQLAIMADEKKKNVAVDVVEKVDRAMRGMFPVDEPGAAIVMMHGDEVLLNKGYGLADVNTKEKISAGTNFNIASISKMFTATAIMLLVEQGKLQLQDPVIKYLTDINPNIGHRITIYELLTHSSGLPHNFQEQDSIMDITKSDKEVYERDKHIDSLDFAPGTRFGYSNIGYSWLSLIIEKVTGVGFRDFMREHVFVAAGMKNSWELNKDSALPNLAHGYRKSGDNFLEYDYGEAPLFATIGDGGVVTSTNDLVAWEKALRAFKVLPKPLFEETIKPQVNSGTEMRNSFYGFGWFIENAGAGAVVYSHSGLNAGFKSYLFRIPEKQIMVAILSNRNDKNVILLNSYIRRVINQAAWN